MKYAVLLLSLFLVACPQPNPNPNIPIVPITGNVCEDACNAWAEFAKQDELCKKEAEPTKSGKTCVQVCNEIESTGFTTVYPACIPKAKNCQEAKKFSSVGCE